jgi:hypothetical protein
MKPDEITSQQALSSTFSRNYNSPSGPSTPSNQDINTLINSETITPSQLNNIHFSQLDRLNTYSRDIALEIRKINQSLEIIDAHLQEMRASLEGIVKVYPPYPPESTERIEALRQFSTLRKMIDQIAHPKSIQGMDRVLADPNRSALAGDWTMVVGDAQTEFTIRHLAVHTGQGGLDIPDIDHHSSDQQISAALDQIALAQKVLKSSRQNFIADANHVITKIV